MIKVTFNSLGQISATSALNMLKTVQTAVYTGMELWLPVPIQISWIAHRVLFFFIRVVWNLRVTPLKNIGGGEGGT